MGRSAEQLRMVAVMCRDMAESCYSHEAKDALLEVSEDLDEEADRMLFGKAAQPQQPQQPVSGGGRR